MYKTSLFFASLAIVCMVGGLILTSVPIILMAIACAVISYFVWAIKGF